MSSSRERRRALLDIATQQGNYFTAHQALGIGYAYPRQHYHVQNGDWERVARGVFRLHGYPQQEWDDLIVLSLLSHDRAGVPQATVSHETALAFHKLGDANPARIHLTVPPGFRREMSVLVALHYARLEKADWEEYEGFRVTTPLRTLLDIASSPTGWPHLASAVRDALHQGMVRSRQLTSAALASDAMLRMLQAIAEASEKAGVEQ